MQNEIEKANSEGMKVVIFSGTPAHPASVSEINEWNQNKGLLSLLSKKAASESVYAFISMNSTTANNDHLYFFDSSSHIHYMHTDWVTYWIELHNEDSIFNDRFMFSDVEDHAGSNNWFIRVRSPTLHQLLTKDCASTPQFFDLSE